MLCLLSIFLSPLLSKVIGQFPAETDTTKNVRNWWIPLLTTALIVTTEVFSTVNLYGYFSFYISYTLDLLIY